MNALTITRKAIDLADLILSAVNALADATEQLAYRVRCKAADLHVERLRSARKANAADVIAASVKLDKFVSDCKQRAKEQEHAAIVAEAEMEAKRRKAAAVNVALAFEAAKLGRSL